MANDKQKCPICGTKLKMMNGRMTCKDCGYYVRDDSTNPYGTGYQTSGTQYSYTGQSTYGSGTASSDSSIPGSATQQTPPGPQPVSQNRPPSTYTPSRPASSGSGSSLAKRVGIIIAVLFGINVISGAIYAVIQLSSVSRQESEEARRDSGEHTPSQDDNSSQSFGRFSSSIPQSNFFRELVEIIFDKTYTQVTAEELASITALQIDFDNKELYYQVDYEDGIPLVFENPYGISLSDLKYFSGLEGLYLIGKGLEDGDLTGLQNLHYIQSENSLEELAHIVPYPENIWEIYTVDTFFTKNLTGVENFTNLEYLTVDYRRLEDISDLTKVPDLLGLILIDCSLTDYSPLMSMTGLEMLSIDSSQLKSIDFIKVMPNLTYLDIENSEIPNIDAVSSCPNLTNLYLIKNYSVTDYSPIENLTNLTDLSIHKTTTKDAPIPSFEKLTQLERVSITNLDEHELPLVAAAGNINMLYLEHNYDDANLELLKNLPLTYLALTDCSISGDHPLAFLTEMPDLTYLDLSDSYVFGNIEDIFGIPSLTYLDLKEATGVIDFDNLPYNESLLCLDMSGFDIKVEAWGQEYQNITDHYDMFEHFPNMEELYVASLGIDTIDFVTNMPYLMYLDITDNNVTSLKPLESLFDFYTVYCGGNTILENVSAESDIYVDMDSEYYPYD